MKVRLGFLITGNIAGVLVTSAVVFAQAPKIDAPPAPTTSRRAGPAQREIDAAIQARNHFAAQPEKARAVELRAAGLQKAMAAQFQKAVAAQPRIVRPPNLENVVAQYMRQARPLVRAEQIFVRKVCALDREQFRRIHADTEVAFKKAITQFVESQQQARVRVVGRIQRTVEVPDAIALLREGLAAALKNGLTPDQFARYTEEVEKRDAYQKRCGVAYLVEAIDRDIFLSDEQRVKLTESLSAHWDPSWQSCLEYLLYGNRFFPAGVDPYVTPYLDSSQAKIWAGVQRVARLGGMFGMLGPFINDADMLQPELDEEPAAGSRPGAPPRQRAFPKDVFQKVDRNAGAGGGAAAKK